MPYLSQEALKGLKEYVYKPSGYTWVDAAHQPLWNYLVSVLPIWFAPNLITLLGLVGLLIASVITFFYVPDYDGAGPSWMYTFGGVTILMYANLDSLDGKQARRTGSSSPLGQLFDHGVDAYVVHLMIAGIMTCVGQSCGVRAMMGTAAVMLPWILAQWEEYHTGTMSYGNGYWGVMEALYAATGLHFVTAACGNGIWNIPLGSYAGVDILIVDAVLVVLLSSSILLACGQVWRVCTMDTSKFPEHERGKKALGTKNALWHIAVLLTLIITAAFWIGHQTYARGECRAAFTTVGTAFSHTATELIVAHMAKMPFQPSVWPYVVLIAGALHAHWPIISTFYFALGALVLVGIPYMHYVMSIVNQICAFLNINCFTIRPVKTS